MEEIDALRTTVVPLTKVSDATREALHETADQYYWCKDETSDECWSDPKAPDDLRTVKRAVRDDIYARLKRETDLNANLVQAAIKQVVENVKGAKTDWKKGRRVSKPESTQEDGWMLNFDKRCSTFSKHGIELSLADGNIHSTEFVLPSELAGSPYSENVLSELFEYRTTRIEHRPHGEHEFYAHIVTKAEFEVPPITTNNVGTIEKIVAGNHSVRAGWREHCRFYNDSDTQVKHSRVLGVDLNVTGTCAVTSIAGFHGNADYLNHKRTQFEQVRAGLQQTGTRSAHLTMKSRKKREWAWFDQLAHMVANDVCIDAIRSRSTHVAFEVLEGIRKRISNLPKYQQWFFNRIQQYAEYKLEPYGITVDDVTARHTSQACSRTDCGHAARSNRDKKHFCCGECGYELDADLNAAKNIAYRYVREEIRGESLSSGEKWFDPLTDADVDSDGVLSGRKSQAGRANCQLALKSGTITLHGNFCPEAWPKPTGQFTDKPLPQQSESTVKASD